MARVLLGVTGSVAAIRTPDLYRAICAAGHNVRIVATTPALYFFDPLQLNPSVAKRDSSILTLDEDEWPGECYRRDQPVLHIELRRWAELFVIAPLDANTLAKIAQGLSDNCLTCVWRAWDPARPILLAPAMNTLMWEHPLTCRHLRQLAADFCDREPTSPLPLEGLVTWINEHSSRLQMVGPQSKRLACGDVGLGAMAEVADIVQAVSRMLQPGDVHLPSGTADR